MTRTFFLKFLTVLLAVAGLTACKGDGPSAPVERVVPAAKPHGWQVVLQYGNTTPSQSFAVSAVKTDKYMTIGINSLDVVRPATVYNLVNQGDTVWVGYGVMTGLYTQNFAMPNVRWSLSGTMGGLDTAKTAVGAFSSMYQLAAFDWGYNQMGPVFNGSHVLSTSGENWKATEWVSSQGLFMWNKVSVVLMPIVCKSFSTQKITSGGISELQTDGENEITGKYPVSDITVTCNLPAPALREAGEVLPMKLTEYVKTLR